MVLSSHHLATQIDDATLEGLIEDLRRGFSGDPGTTRHTLRRIMARVEMTKTAGTLYLHVPAGLFAGTPGEFFIKGRTLDYAGIPRFQRISLNEHKGRSPGLGLGLCSLI